MKILKNTQIAKETFEMILEPIEDCKKLEQIFPGQFLNIKVSDFYLRRPISIADWNEKNITIVYKVVGKGTEKMSKLVENRFLDVLWPLGNGYHTGDIPEDSILIGGGAGVPPIYGLAKRLIREEKRIKIILGFKNREEVFWQEKFKTLAASYLGNKLEIFTEDGSYGKKGFVTDGYKNALYTCGCGPEPMLKAIYEKSQKGQYSFEARMGCGFGACMGCSCETLAGNKRLCKEGPVLKQEEILWK